MSFERAIKNRKADLLILQKALKQQGGKADELVARVEGLKAKIAELEEKQKVRR